MYLLVLAVFQLNLLFFWYMIFSISLFISFISSLSLSFSLLLLLFFLFVVLSRNTSIGLNLKRREKIFVLFQFYWKSQCFTIKNNPCYKFLIDSIHQDHEGILHLCLLNNFLKITNRYSISSNDCSAFIQTFVIFKLFIY